MKSSSLPIALLVLVASSLGQDAPKQRDCSTLRYVQHKVSCLCGKVSVCSGDMCGRPADYGLDDNIVVELRDKTGKTVIESKKAVVETTKREGTTQDNRKAVYTSTDRKFCFEGRPDGKYQLAFIVQKNGVPQPAVTFPTTYSRSLKKACDSVYMVEPSCPK